MGTKGSFGYKIGRKTRLMYVQYDADMLWQTCVREIFVLMKHYGTIELLQEAFENLKDAKGKPKQEAIEKCKYYIDLTAYPTPNLNDWYNLTRNCQHSFINILDTGYFLNNGSESGFVFLLDFNTKTVSFYGVNYDDSKQEYEKATIDEMMEFDDLPTKTYTEIVTETKIRAEKYSNIIKKYDDELDNIKELIQKVKEHQATQHMIEQANLLLEETRFQRSKLELEYRYFYHRMDALNLIDHGTTEEDS